MPARIALRAVVSGLALATSVGLTAQGGLPARNGLIVGQVIDGVTNRPVAQATVSLGGGAPPAPGAAAPSRVLTGADGYFVFRELPPGRFTVTAHKHGYLTGQAGQQQPGGSGQPIQLAANARVGDVVVKLWKTASIAGTLLDESGEALVRVQVTLLRKAVVGGHVRLVPNETGSTTFTDDRGSYRFGSLAPGEYLVAMTEPPQALSLSLAREIAARHGASGHGFGPAVQVGESLLQLIAGTPMPPPARDGRLEIYPPAFYPGVDAASQGSLVQVAPGDERVGVDLQLRPAVAVAVRGRVIGASPTRAPLLVLTRADGETAAPELPGSVGATDADGAFVFPAVPPGQYILRVTAMTDGSGSTLKPDASSVQWARVPIGVGTEDVNDVTVILQDGLRVRGRVQFDGRRPPPSGALQQVPLTIEPTDGSPILSSRSDTGPVTTRVGASGEFTSPGLPAGRYVVRVTNSPQGWMFRGAFYGGRDISASAVEMFSDVDGVVLQFTDRWTGLQGWVRDGRGQAARDVTVLVFPFDPADWIGYGPNPRRLRAVRTTAAGMYSFDPLPPGDYHVVALRDEPLEWRDPSVLHTLSRAAMRVTVGADGKTTMDLRIPAALARLGER